MKTCSTFWANIYCGLCEGYDGKWHDYDEVTAICQHYCDHFGLGVTCTRTSFFYTGGMEPGVIIGLIHYPRFPHERPEQIIRNHALELGRRLLLGLGQHRVSIVMPTETVMLEKEDVLQSPTS